MRKLFSITTVLLVFSIHGVWGQEALPLGWHSTDIGSQSVPGSTIFDPDAEIFTIESTGDQIFRPDNLHFAYTVQTGNFEIVTLVSYISGMGDMGFDVDPYEEAGLMIREDLSPFSNTYYLSVLGGTRGGIRYYVRNNAELEKTPHPGEGARNMLVPCWLKLKRVGNSFDSYYSQDGINWIYSPDANENIAMNATCYAGLWCRGNANFVEINGWDNPNPQPIVPAVSEFEATRIEEIANIYTVQNPLSIQFVSLHKDTSYINVSSVFGRLEGDEIEYAASSSNSRVCRVNVLDGTDSIFFRPRAPGSCNMTLTGDVNSFSLVNKFPVFVWEAPEGWLSTDVGKAGTSGYVMKEGELFTIGGSTDASLQEPSEGYHYMYRVMEGDATITARISSVYFGTMGGFGGIKFSSDSVEQDAVMAQLVYNADGMVRVESRATQGDTVILVGESPVTVPCWIRLEKEGPVLTGYQSEDGQTWSLIGSDSIPALGIEYTGGIIAGSIDNENLSSLIFDQVNLESAIDAVLNPVTDQSMTTGGSLEINVSGVFGHPPGQLPIISIENTDPDVVEASLVADSMLVLSAVAPGEAVISLTTGTEPDILSTTFNAMVTEPLEPDWKFEDIGMPANVGSAVKLDEQVYSISTFGDMIAGTADRFSFLYKEIAGAQEIVAKIASIEERGNASQAGIMFRESTDAGSLYITYNATAYEGIKLKYRWDDDSQPVVEISDPEIEPPCWLRLKRDEFNYFSAAYSMDGITWIPHGEFSIPLDLPETSLVGLAATSGFNEGTSVFEEVNFLLPTAIGDHHEPESVGLNLFPNPFRESTTLRIHVQERTRMRITLFSVTGKKVVELMNGPVMPGGHHVMINAEWLESGTYFIRVVTPETVITQKLLKIK
jgi:hypothetical protein